MFDQPAEIHDHEGHYIEVIDRAAFNRAIDHAPRARGGFPGSVKVLYNHGMTIHGTPSERFSMPIGIPVDIRAEARGLLTRTRYSETPLADEVLENIRAGSITSPVVHRPDRPLRPAAAPRRPLPARQRREPDHCAPHRAGPARVRPGAVARLLGRRDPRRPHVHSRRGAPDPDEIETDDATGTPPDDGPATGDPLTP